MPARSGRPSGWLAEARGDRTVRFASSWTVADQGQKLLAGRRRFAKRSQHGRGNHHRVLLFDPAHHHAQVARFDHHAHALGVDRLHDFLGYLLGEALLKLQPSRVHVHHPRQLGHAEYPAARYIADVAPPEKGEHVVFAKAVHLDVLHDHHTVRFLREHGAVDEPLHVDAVAGGKELEGLADFDQQLAYQRLDFGAVYLHRFRLLV